MESREAMVRRVIWHLPQRAVAAAVEGDGVSIVGEVRSRGVPLRSPVRGIECVAYWLSVFAIEHDHDHLYRWQRVLDERMGVDFDIADASGSLQVRVEGAEWALHQDFWEHRFPGQLEPGVHAALDRAGIHPAGRLSLGEGVLCAGSEVAVCGQYRRELSRDPRAAVGYRGVAEDIFLGRTASFPLAICNQPLLIRYMRRAV